MDIQVFSDRIRKLRGDRSQREVAEGIGTTHQSLGRYESGKRKPDLDIIERMAVYFEVSADYLLGLNSDPTPDFQIQAASALTGLSQTVIEQLIEIRMGESMQNVDVLLDYIVGALTPEFLQGIIDAHNLTMDRYRERSKLLHQYNKEHGTEIPEELLAGDLYDYAEASKRGMKAEMLKFDAYYEKDVLARCQNQFKEPDTTYKKLLFERQSRQYASYYMYRSDYMYALVREDIDEIVKKIKRELFEHREYFGESTDEFIELFRNIE